MILSVAHKGLASPGNDRWVDCYRLSHSSALDNLLSDGKDKNSYWQEGKLLLYSANKDKHFTMILKKYTTKRYKSAYDKKY